MWFSKFASVALVTAFVLSAFQVSVGQEDPVEIVLRCAVNPISTFNPLLDDPHSQRVLRLVYDSAIIHDPDTGEIHPYIAVGTAPAHSGSAPLKWEDCQAGIFDYAPADTWSDAGKPEIIVFYDFRDVMWHDGVQMGIRDIMFNFHAWATQQYSWLGHPLKDLSGGPGSNYSQSQWLAVREEWSSDDGLRAALRFTLQEPRFSVFEYYLSAPLLPYHIWGGKASGQSVDNAKIWYDQGYDPENETFWQPSAARGWTNPKPVGSGPFEWVGSSRNGITLRTWDEHFYGPGFRYASILYPAVRPAIHTLSLEYYSYRENALMGLESGEIHMMAWELSDTEIYRFAGNPNIETHTLAGTSAVNLVFNMDRSSFGYAPGKGDSGKPLRIAMAHCVNSSKIASIVGLSMAEPPDTLFGNWQNLSAPRYAHDPGQAVNILYKAGYTLSNPAIPPGPDNTWLNPDGTSMGVSDEGRIEMLLPDNDQDTLAYRVGTALCNQLREIGIDVALTPMDTDTLWERVLEGDFEVCIARQGFRTRSLAQSSTPIDGGGGPSPSNRPPSPPSAPSPFDGETDVAMYRPLLSVRVFDPDGDTMSVEFRWAETNILIGRNHEVRSGETVSIEAPILDPQTTYSWYVTVQDHQYNAVSPTWSFTTERGFSRSSEAAEHSEPLKGTRSKLESFSMGHQLPRIYSARPENFYFSNFHTDSIAAGMNYCRYRNSSHDIHIESAMFPTDPDAERANVRDALASIGYDIPMFELYHPISSEATRSDSFTGFLDDGTGTLLNPRSMANVRVQEKQQLRARFVQIPMTSTSNSTFPLLIRVTDNAGQPMAGASVSLEHTSGILSESTGITDHLGLFRTDFTSPEVPLQMETGMPLMISLTKATLEGYRDAEPRHMPIMVYPPGARYLSVSAMPVLDVVESGGFTELDILVTDSANLPVSSATISIETSGDSLVPEIEWATTDQDGRARIRLEAVETSSAEECTIVVGASKVGHIPASCQASVMVVPGRVIPGSPGGGPGPLLLMAIPAVIMLACAAYLWRRMAKRKRRSD